MKKYTAIALLAAFGLTACNESTQSLFSEHQNSQNTSSDPLIDDVAAYNALATNTLGHMMDAACGEASETSLQSEIPSETMLFLLNCRENYFPQARATRSSYTAGLSDLRKDLLKRAQDRTLAVYIAPLPNEDYEVRRYRQINAILKIKSIEALTESALEQDIPAPNQDPNSTDHLEHSGP